MLPRIAILGGTGHLAKSLVDTNAQLGKWSIDLYVRDKPRAEAFIKRYASVEPAIEVLPIDSFNQDSRCDALVNCIGFGTPAGVSAAKSNLFSVTQLYDRLIDVFVQKQSHIPVVSFSSGAIYGSQLAGPIQDGHVAQLPIDPIDPVDFYRITKLASEAYHRSLFDKSIVDIRLFNFFSEFIDLTTGFLVADIASALLTDSSFVTNRTDVARDFFHPTDLYRLVDGVIRTGNLNAAIDAISLEPITKLDLIGRCQREYGLKVAFQENSFDSPTGIKSYYYSQGFEKNKIIDFSPKFTSWDSIKLSLDKLLSHRKT